MNLREQYAAAQKAAKDIHDKATAENRAKTDEEQETFNAHVAEGLRLKAMIAQVDADKESMAELGDTIADSTDSVSHPKGSTPGDRFVNSDAYGAMKAAYPDGLPQGARPVMGTVSVGGFRNAVTVSESMTPPLHRIAPASLSTIDIFDAINVIEDAPDAVKIFRTSFENNAAVADPGSQKVASNLTITPDTVNLETIAHHTPVNNQTLWHNSMLRNRIDVHMINGVRAKAQAEVADELLAQIALMQTQAFDTDIATTLRRAYTKAYRGVMEIGGDPANVAVAISPEDHETLDLELLDAMVALAGQELVPTGRIWRSRVVPLYGLTPGVAFVGDLKQVDFYVGTQGITVTTGWINDQFIRNQVTILGEMEAKAAVIGGAALVATDLDGDSAPDLS
jgi:hypothetical protein